LATRARILKTDMITDRDKREREWIENQGRVEQLNIPQSGTTLFDDLMEVKDTIGLYDFVAARIEKWDKTLDVQENTPANRRKNREFIRSCEWHPNSPSAFDDFSIDKILAELELAIEKVDKVGCGSMIPSHYRPLSIRKLFGKGEGFTISPITLIRKTFRTLARRTFRHDRATRWSSRNDLRVEN
jgi:hypothetical protein